MIRRKGASLSHHMLDPRAMVRHCRRLAADIREEHEQGLPPIQLSFIVRQDYREEAVTVTRAEAAMSLEAQADRWQHEVDTGEPNRYDRDKLNM